MALFEPRETTKIAVMSQLEQNPNKPPVAVIDNGQMSAGYLMLHGDNIDFAMDNLRQDRVSQPQINPDFSSKWDAMKAIQDPVLRKTERQALIAGSPNDMTVLGARWTKFQGDTSAQYGYGTDTPHIMAHQQPWVVAGAIAELTGEKPQGINKRFTRAQQIWPKYVAQVGQEQAAVNLLEHIKKMRARDLPLINKQRLAADPTSKPYSKVEEEPVWTRANRMLTEPLAGTKIPLIKALQQPSLDITALPPDLQKFFKDTAPGVKLPTDANVVAADMAHMEKEKALMASEVEAGIPADDPLEQVTGFWDLITHTGDLTRSNLVRSLARMGVSVHELSPEDIPNFVSGDEMLEYLFDYKAPKTGDIDPKNVFVLDKSKPALHQAIEFMSKLPEWDQKVKEFTGSLAIGEAVDVVNLIGLGLVKKTIQFFMSTKYLKEQRRAVKIMESIEKRKQGTNFEDESDMLKEQLANLTELTGDTLTRATQLLKDDPGIIEKMKAILPNTPMNDSQFLVMAMAINKKGDEILDFIHKVGSKGSGDPTVLASLKQQIREFTTLYAPRESAKVATGKALESLKSADNVVANAVGDNFIKVMEQLNLNPEKAFKQLGQFKNSQEMALFMKNVSLPGWGKVYNEILVNGLLSGPMTVFGLNPLGNTAAFMMDIGGRQMAGLFGKGGVPASEAARMMASAGGAVWDGLKLMWRTARSSETNLAELVGTRASKFDVDYNIIRAANFPNMPKFMQGPLNWLGSIIRFPSRLMMAQDEGMKAIFYQAELSAQAGRKARDLPGWDLMSRSEKNLNRKNLLNDMRLNPSKYQSSTDAANQFAHRNTFTAPGGPTMESMVDLANSHPVFKAIFPFVRTPSNIMKRIGSDAGYGSFSKVVRGIRTGDKAVRDEALGRIAFSSTMLMGIVSMVQNGKMVGGEGSVNPRLRNLMRQEMGQDQGSIAFDTDGDGDADRFVGMNPRTHLGQLVNIIGQFTESRGYLGQAQGEQNFIETMVLLVADLLEEAPFIGALGDLAEILSAGEEGGFEHGMQAATKMGAKFLMPLGVGLRQQTRKVTDKFKRDVTPEINFNDPDESGYWKLGKNILDQMLNSTPGYSKDFVPDYSLLTGEPLKYPLGSGPFDYEADPTALQLVNLLAFPMNVTTDRQSDGEGSSAFEKQNMEVARWMVNNDVTIPTLPRKYQGITIPNDLYQQWKVFYTTGHIPDINVRDADGLFDVAAYRNSGLPGLQTLMIPLIRNKTMSQEVPDAARDNRVTTTPQRTAVESIINQQRNTTLQLLLATDPEWRAIFGKAIQNQIQPEQRPVQTPAGRRNKGLSGFNIGQ